MTFTLVLGWWMIPAVITVGAFVWSLLRTVTEPRGGDYSFGPEVVFITTMPAAIIVSLLSWLIWALLT